MYIASRSYYSLRFGTLSPENLVKIAASKEIKVLTLTDINNTSGIPEFTQACIKHGITPIAGTEYRNNNTWLYTGVAKNNIGFQQLNEFTSKHNISKQPFPQKAPQLNNVFFVYPFNSYPKALSDNEYIGIRIAERNKLITVPNKIRQNKIVLLHPITFSLHTDFELHKHLRAINNNTLLSNITKEKLAFGDEIPLSENELSKYFENFPEVINTTNKLLLKCSFNIDFTKSKNKKTYTGNHYSDKLLLEKLAFEGFTKRYNKNNSYALERLNSELAVIDKLNFSAYFLITWDIIHYSLSNGIYHVGRGSGANSIVAYCLKITDVDPIELNLYFERFINPKRSSPPDFDIDFSWRNRDQIHDYIFKRYGYENTALLGAMSTFQGKSIIRELGKTYGLHKSEIDLIIRKPNDPQNQQQLIKKILDIGSKMDNMPNLRTIHAGGVLISEQPITYYTALDMPPKGFQTTQWDMYAAEKLKFEKLDILSQRGIGHINDCAELVKLNKNKNVNIHDVEKFKSDPKVKSLLKKGETVGCFYIESPAMRGLLTKLKCDTYINLVAASSIIRPGVAKSGMMREYIKRFHNPDSIKYIHPLMKQQLSETYGVMVYQEDVLKVCHHFADLNLADADVLRRGMSGKTRSKNEIRLITNKFFSNCKQKGYPEAIVKEVWRQIESFAGYSFSKAHSASYAVESFQSLYLKAHFPIEFIVAVINNFGGYYRTEIYFNEAKRLGATIELPCVNNSANYTTITNNNIYIGFIHLTELEHNTIKDIVNERNIGGSYKSLKNFINRLNIGIKQLTLLIRIGAFRFTNKSKVTLLWEVHMLLGKTQTIKYQKTLSLDIEEKTYSIPTPQPSKIEDTYDEIELLDFPVTLSYFDILKTKFRGRCTARELINNIGKTIKITGQLVAIKYIWTKKKEIMNFGTFIDSNGDFFDTVHFPQSLKKNPFTGNGIYLILGKIVAEFGHPSIEVQRLARLPFKPDQRNNTQRHHYNG